MLGRPQRTARHERPDTGDQGGQDHPRDPQPDRRVAPLPPRDGADQEYRGGGGRAPEQQDFERPFPADWRPVSRPADCHLGRKSTMTHSAARASTVGTPVEPRWNRAGCRRGCSGRRALGRLLGSRRSCVADGDGRPREVLQGSVRRPCAPGSSARRGGGRRQPAGSARGQVAGRAPRGVGQETQPRRRGCVVRGRGFRRPRGPRMHRWARLRRAHLPVRRGVAARRPGAGRRQWRPPGSAPALSPPRDLGDTARPRRPPP